MLSKQAAVIVVGRTIAGHTEPSTSRSQHHFQWEGMENENQVFFSFPFFSSEGESISKNSVVNFKTFDNFSNMQKKHFFKQKSVSYFAQPMDKLV